MIIERTSPLTGKVSVMDIDVTLEEIAIQKSGTFIQNAMPRASQDEREFIKTGYTPEDWELLFPEEE